MKIAYICSRYADPNFANRRRNLAEARALARWAEAQGYAVVTWWGSIEPTDPPCDSDETVRRAALARSAELAGTVGEADGDMIMPSWYAPTPGMINDECAYQACHARNPNTCMVRWSEVEPYYTAPVETVPRAKVQAAVDEIEALDMKIIYKETEFHNGKSDGFQYAIDVITEHTGVTPTEVQ